MNGFCTEWYRGTGDIATEPQRLTEGKNLPTAADTAQETLGWKAEKTSTDNAGSPRLVLPSSRVTLRTSSVQADDIQPSENTTVALFFFYWDCSVVILDILETTLKQAHCYNLLLSVGVRRAVIGWYTKRVVCQKRWLFDAMVGGTRADLKAQYTKCNCSYKLNKHICVELFEVKLS